MSVLMWQAWGASKRLRTLDPDEIQTQLVLPNLLPNLSNTQNNSSAKMFLVGSTQPRYVGLVATCS
jgi:hypothetical protein